MRAKISDKGFHSIRIKITDKLGRDVAFTMKHSGLFVRYPKDMALEIRELILKIDTFFKNEQNKNFGDAFKSLQLIAQSSESFADMSLKLSQITVPT